MLNELNRILFIALVCVGLCIGNAEGAEIFPPHELAFDLPPGTEGLLKSRESQIVVETGCNEYIFFPADGKQLPIEEAGKYSLANVVDDSITDWYIRAFGGNEAIEWSYGKVPTNNLLNGAMLGFEKISADLTEEMEGTTVLKAQGLPKNIITVEGDDENFKIDFWRYFRTIASDPVGRVLLYSLLIEIRRKYSGVYQIPGRDDQISANAGSTENIDGFADLISLGKRNNCRSITIEKADHNTFSRYEQCIQFSADTIKIPVLKIDGDYIQTEDAPCAPDIALFHEMLHWFHYLRNPDRYNRDTDEFDCYLMMFFLGEDYLLRVFNTNNELLTWVIVEFKQEELRTILGAPAYQDVVKWEKDFNEKIITKSTFKPSWRFLNGDDLSENVYRMSRHGQSNPVRMRFGHANAIRPIHIIDKAKESFKVDETLLSPYRFLSANILATRCYQRITGNSKKQWGLAKNEAAN